MSSLVKHIGMWSLEIYWDADGDIQPSTVHSEMSICIADLEQLITRFEFNKLNGQYSVHVTTPDAGTVSETVRNISVDDFEISITFIGFLSDSTMDCVTRFVRACVAAVRQFGLTSLEVGFNL
jgi:hypothetical protein